MKMSHRDPAGISEIKQEFIKYISADQGKFLL
jgi:hypothetical protein